MGKNTFCTHNFLIELLKTKQNILSQHVHLNYSKNMFHFYSLPYIRTSGKKHRFWRQKKLKSHFYENKKVTSTDDMLVNY